MKIFSLNSSRNISEISEHWSRSEESGGKQEKKKTNVSSDHAQWLYHSQAMVSEVSEVSNND